MVPTIISKKAGNWVDRGEPANPTLRRVLAYFFERFDPLDDAWLDEHATIILGMVAADATEVHIAGYLRSVVRETGARRGNRYRHDQRPLRFGTLRRLRWYAISLNAYCVERCQ